MASSLMDDGRLRTELKCSSRLLRILARSMIKLDPSASGVGMCPMTEVRIPLSEHHKIFLSRACQQMSGSLQMYFRARCLACFVVSSGQSGRYLQMMLFWKLSWGPIGARNEACVCLRVCRVLDRRSGQTNPGAFLWWHR